MANTIEAFNKMYASADSRLIPQVKKFQDLGIRADQISLEERL
jgi:hypothetical protein